MDGGGGIGNKAQLRPAKAGAGAWPELCNTSLVAHWPLSHHLPPAMPYCALNPKWAPGGPELGDGVFMGFTLAFGHSNHFLENKFLI